MSNNKVREPLFHIVKRGNLSVGASWLIRILSVVAALIVCGVVTIVLTGENPIKIYSTMIEGAIGSERRIWSLFQNVAILLCIALAVTPSWIVGCSRMPRSAWLR